MVDEQEPVRRVVKRVVKKTVVRPADAPAPSVRYGRPAPTSSRPVPRAPTQTAPRPAAKVASRPAAKTPPAAPAAPKARRPPIELRARVSGAGQRIADAWWVVADGARSSSRGFRTSIASGARAVAAWRLPHLPAYLAAAVTGTIVAAASLVLGVVALEIFRDVRGVATGGGLWGGITFVAIAALAAVLGGALLSGFGTASPRLTSVLAVIVTIVALLGLFLEQAQGMLVLVIVPALSIASYLLAHWLIDVAENTPAAAD